MWQLQGLPNYYLRVKELGFNVVNPEDADVIVSDSGTFNVDSLAGKVLCRNWFKRFKRC